MSTSYSIFHTDGLALHFVNREQAAAWAVGQPINSTVARLFLAFMESPSVLAPDTDAVTTLRMYGAWTFTVSFNSDNPNPVLGRDAIQRYADAMDYPFNKAAFTLSQLGYLTSLGKAFKMKQFSSNEFRVYGGELYVTEDGFRRIFVKASITDIYPMESKMVADIILRHFQDDHDDEMMTIDGTVYVTVFTIMDHVDVELNKHSLMFARMFAKLFDAVGNELSSLDPENPEDWPYLSSGVARAYLEILKIVEKYLQVAEIWWKLQ